MRTTLLFFWMLAVAASRTASAQAPLDVGTPQAAFAGGPIRLSSRAAGCCASITRATRCR